MVGERVVSGNVNGRPYPQRKEHQSWQTKSDIVIRKTFVDGPDVLTWYDLHTTVASPVPVANWLHIEDGKITSLRVAFDARELAP